MRPMGNILGTEVGILITRLFLHYVARKKSSTVLLRSISALLQVHPRGIVHVCQRVVAVLSPIIPVPPDTGSCSSHTPL